MSAFFGKFVLLSFVFNNLVGSFVKFFSSAHLPRPWKLETGNWKFETGSAGRANRQSKNGNLYSVAGGQPSGPASCEFFAEAMGIGTWRGRGRARQARRGASRAYPAASFRAEATPPSGTASNFYAVILWITYQEIKGGMHCDLTKNDLDEALIPTPHGR